VRPDPSTNKLAPLTANGTPGLNGPIVPFLAEEALARARVRAQRWPTAEKPASAIPSRPRDATTSHVPSTANGQTGENTANVQSLAEEERKPEPEAAMDHSSEDLIAMVSTRKLSLAGPANVRSMACLVNGPNGANVPKTVAVESRRDPVNVKDPSSAEKIAKETELKSRIATPSPVPLMEFGKTGGNGAIAPKLAQAVTRKEPGNVTDLSTEVRNVWVAQENPTSVTCRLAPLMASLNHGESGVHVPPHAAEERGRVHVSAKTQNMAVWNAKERAKRPRSAAWTNAPLMEFGESGDHGKSASTESRCPSARAKVLSLVARTAKDHARGNRIAKCRLETSQR